VAAGFFDLGTPYQILSFHAKQPAGIVGLIVVARVFVFGLPKSMVRTIVRTPTPKNVKIKHQHIHLAKHEQVSHVE
jgi:hypothetical protein